MKHRLVKRDFGIEVPGLTEATLVRLEEPYNLIAEWAQYVPLDVLLEIDFLAMACFCDNDDGTVTLEWQTIPPALRQFIVPFPLFRKTVLYLFRLHRSNERLRISGHGNAIFIRAGRDVRMTDWIQVLSDALSTNA